MCAPRSIDHATARVLALILKRADADSGQPQAVGAPFAGLSGVVQLAPGDAALCHERLEHERDVVGYLVRLQRVRDEIDRPTFDLLEHADARELRRQRGQRGGQRLRRLGAKHQLAGHQRIGAVVGERVATDQGGKENGVEAHERHHKTPVVTKGAHHEG